MLSGEVIRTTGTRAHFTPSPTVVMLPAGSVAIAVLQVAPVAMPAPGSEQSKCTVTGLLFHPFAFGAGVSVALIDGGPKSILIASLVADAVFPALSVTVPMTVLMPSAVVTWSDGQVSTPDPGSTHVKWAVTGPLYQPFAFGDGVSVTRMTGCA